MLYFSSLLSNATAYRPAAKRLFAALDAAGLPYRLLEHTRDIWLRDFMPVRSAGGTLIAFRYEPSYLRGYPRLRTDYRRELAPRLPFPVRYSDINLDGGNVVFSPDRSRVILSDRVLTENLEYAADALLNELERLLEAQVVLIPSLKSDLTGHTDGMVRFVDETTVIGNRTGYKRGLEQRIRSVLRARGLNVVDFPYVDLYTAQYYLRNVSHSSLQMTSQAYTPRSVCFGLVKPTEHELLNILNKEINQISDADMQNITSQNVNQFREVTLADLIFWYPVESMLTLGAIGLVIIGLLLFLFLKKARLSRTLRRKAMEDGLTTLYNSAACRKLVMKKLREMGTDQLGAFLLMDIDDFKEVNDRYGHQTGDRILCQFSELLKETLPEDSIIARIGGDEFVVYLESVRSEAEIAAVCDRLREASHVIFVGAEHITISVGAATAHKEDDYDTLYHLADKHMYEVKRNQKSRFSQPRSEIVSVGRPS